MPFKRTRSAAVKQPAKNSSNVTGDTEPPTAKRQKNTVQPAKTSARVTRTAQAAPGLLEEPQSGAASMGHKTRQQDVEEDEDDDGSIHVAFNEVSLAVNEALSGQPRALRGPRHQRQAGLKGLGEDENEEEEGETLPATKRSRAVKAKQIQQQAQLGKQQNKPKARSQAKKTAGSSDAIQDEHTPRQRLRPRAGEASTCKTSSDKSTPIQSRQGQESAEKPAAPGQDDQRDEDESASEDGGVEEYLRHAVAQAAEDSAFIDAPRPDEKLPEVSCTVNSLGGMIKTLSHLAWTGTKNWDENPDMACSTKTAGSLIECLRQLNDLLLESSDARYGRDAGGDPEVTTNYLRRESMKIKRLFAEITGLVDQICTQKLAPEDSVGPRGVKTRKRLLSDIMKRLIPMLVLVLQKAYDVGPIEEKRSVVHLTLNSFTIQFLLRTIGWATRLMEAFSRGLIKWPIDEDFDQSDEELEIEAAVKKQGKIKAREKLRSQLASLYSNVKNAADVLERQAGEAEKRQRQEQDRRRILIRGRELWAKAERERREADRSVEERFDKFAQATWALRSMPNPLTVMWKQAGQFVQAPKSVQASAANAPIPVPRLSKVNHKKVIPQSENDEDFFLHSDRDNDRFDGPIRDDPVPGNHRPHSGVLKTINGLQNAQELEAWGAPRWSKVEEKRLLLWMKSDKRHKPSTVAHMLARSVEDVARKAAELKTVYRAIYRNRGVEMPTWVW